MFGSNNKSTSLVKKSSNAISIFTKTLADLTAVNEEMEQEDSRLAREQELMQQQRDEMQKAIRVNNKVSTKIEDILNIDDEGDILDSSTPSK